MQSMTAAGILGTVTRGAIPSQIAHGFELFAVLYSVPFFWFVLLWTCMAILLALRAHRRQMKFALTYWAFTFPVRTCVTGITQLKLILLCQVNLFAEYIFSQSFYPIPLP